MNQPRQSTFPGPYQVEYEVSYPPLAPGPVYGGRPSLVPPSPGPAAPAQPHRSSGPPPPKRTPVPILVAAGLVAALVAGIGLALLLRGDRLYVPGPTPGQVTQSFFAAMDQQDEAGMKGLARGDVLDDIEDILVTDLAELGVVFAAGQVTGSGEQQTDDVRLAAVTWELADVPPELTDEPTLALLLLDDGDGYRVCHIDEADGTSVSALLAGFETEFETVCAYAPK